MIHEYDCPVCRCGKLFHRKTTLATVNKQTVGKAYYTCDHKGCLTTLIVKDKVILKHWVKKSSKLQRAAAWLLGDDFKIFQPRSEGTHQAGV